MSRGGGGGIEKALVQILDENGCVDGWAVQVTGDLIPADLVVETLTVNDTITTEDLEVSGTASVDSDLSVGGNADITGSVGVGGGVNVGTDLVVGEDLGVVGNTNLQTLEVNQVISDLFILTPNGGKFLQTSLVAIDTTAQAFIADGANDVTEYIRIDGLITNGTTRAFLGFSLQHGGTDFQNIVTGAETWQYRLNADGSVDVRRTAGALTGTSVIRAMWL